MDTGSPSSISKLSLPSDRNFPVVFDPAWLGRLSDTVSTDNLHIRTVDRLSYTITGAVPNEDSQTGLVCDCLAMTTDDFGNETEAETLRERQSTCLP